MTRLMYVVIGMAGGFALATAVLASHAEDLDRVLTTDTIAAANEAGVGLVDLMGAVATTGVPARAYLQAVGELAAPTGVAPPTRLDALVECLAWHESRGLASAYNRRSGASGLLQFLPSTFAQTPQGKAGFSPFDAQAARAAARWMINQGRLKEWSTWRLCA